MGMWRKKADPNVLSDDELKVLGFIEVNPGTTIKVMEWSLGIKRNRLVLMMVRLESRMKVSTVYAFRNGIRNREFYVTSGCVAVPGLYGPERFGKPEQEDARIIAANRPAAPVVALEQKLKRSV